MSGALALAFGAGMVATVNPCGFAMLPAYLSYFMGIQDQGHTKAAATRAALLVGSVVSMGFLVVFGIAGLVISGISTRIAADWIPWLALGVGAGLVVLGLAMLRGFELTVGLPKAGRASSVRSYRNIFAFGVSYAIASLSCTLPVFLTLIATQFSARSLGGGLVIFAVYAAGMTVVLLAITLILALGKRSVLTRVRGFGAHINRVAGGLLVVAGVWISWFWITTLRSGAATLGSSSSFRFMEDLSQRIVNFVADNTLAVGVALGLVVAVAVLVAAPRGAADSGASAEVPDPTAAARR